MGIAGVLLVAFIILKLCEVIAWPWIWVLAPLWISIIIAMLWFVIHLLFIKWISK